MQKRIIDPTAGNDLLDDDTETSSTAFSSAVAIKHPDHYEMFISGATANEPDLAIGDQTRDILEQFEAILNDHNGNIKDIVRVRVYVEEPALTPDNLDEIHAARREFFLEDQFPASTLVEVAGLIRDGRHIEIDADAIIPADGSWELT